MNWQNKSFDELKPFSDDDLRPVRALAQLLDISEDEVLAVVEEVYYEIRGDIDPTSKLVKTKTDMLGLCVNKARTKFKKQVMRSIAKSWDVIIIGFETRREGRKGVYSRLYVIVNEEGKPRVRNIFCSESTNSDHLYKQVTPFCLYKDVKLLQFSDGNLMAVEATEFKDPMELEASPLDILNTVGLRPLSLGEYYQQPSSVNENGWVVLNDLRMIRGTIVRTNQFDSIYELDGGKRGVYTVEFDVTRLSEKDIELIKENGYDTQVTVWVPQPLSGLPVNSICYFIGTTRVNKGNNGFGEVPTMNAIMIVPEFIPSRREEL